MVEAVIPCLKGDSFGFFIGVTQQFRNSQISCVFQHPLKKNLYIAMADRWITDPAQNLPYHQSAAAFESICNLDAPRVDLGCLNMEIDTSYAGYVWLPISFDDDHPYIEWSEEWILEDYT